MARLRVQFRDVILTNDDADLILGCALGLVARKSENLDEVFALRDALIREAVAEAVALLKSEESSVRGVAEGLLATGRLSEAEVLRVVGGETSSGVA
jgi:hypothetical protein